MKPKHAHRPCGGNGMAGVPSALPTGTLAVRVGVELGQGFLFLENAANPIGSNN